MPYPTIFVINQIIDFLKINGSTFLFGLNITNLKIYLILYIIFFKIKIKMTVILFSIYNI